MSNQIAVTSAFGIGIEIRSCMCAMVRKHLRILKQNGANLPKAGNVRGRVADFWRTPSLRLSRESKADLSASFIIEEILDGFDEFLGFDRRSSFRINSICIMLKAGRILIFGQINPFAILFFNPKMSIDVIWCFHPLFHLQSRVHSPHNFKVGMGCQVTIARGRDMALFVPFAPMWV